MSGRADRFAEILNDDSRDASEAYQTADRSDIHEAIKEGLLTCYGAVRLSQTAQYEEVCVLAKRGAVTLLTAQTVREEWREPILLSYIAEREDVDEETLTFLAEECWEDEIVTPLLSNRSLPGHTWLDLIVRAEEEGWSLTDRQLSNMRNVRPESIKLHIEGLLEREPSADVETWDEYWKLSAEERFLNLNFLSFLLCHYETPADTVNLMLCLPAPTVDEVFFLNPYCDEVLLASAVKRVLELEDSPSWFPAGRQLEQVREGYVRSALSNSALTAEGFFLLAGTAAEFGFAEVVAEMVREGAFDKIIYDILHVVAGAESEALILSWARKLVAVEVLKL